MEHRFVKCRKELMRLLENKDTVIKQIVVPLHFFWAVIRNGINSAFFSKEKGIVVRILGIEKARFNIFLFINWVCES